MEKITLVYYKNSNSKKSGRYYAKEPYCCYLNSEELADVIRDKNLEIVFDKSVESPNALFLHIIKNNEENARPVKNLSKIIRAGGFVEYIRKLSAAL